MHHLRALAVEAEAVDHGLVAIQPKHARTRIAHLWPRRHGADLDKAEAETQQCVRHLTMLVETGSNADRVGKGQAKGPDRQPIVVGFRRQPRRQFQRAHHQTMGVFRLHPARERPDKTVNQADHNRSLRAGGDGIRKPPVP